MAHGRTIVEVLRASHDRLAAAVSGLDAEGLRGPSYDNDWSLAQVVSHLGSGAEVIGAMVTAALLGRPLPGAESFPPIWDRWNAMAPSEALGALLEEDGTLVERFERLDDTQLALRVDVFGMSTDLAGLGRMRLSELCLHTWDVAVMADPGASLAEDAAAILVDELGSAASRTGRPGTPARCGCKIRFRRNRSSSETILRDTPRCSTVGMYTT